MTYDELDDLLRDDERRKKEWQGRESQRPVIKLVPFGEIHVGGEPEYLIKGLIPADGITVVWGAPKSHKSFFTFDVAMRVALGWHYRGRKVQQASVVYCAFEGQSGFNKRVAAFRQRFLADYQAPVPFYLQPLRLDLVRHAGDLIDAAKE